MKSDHTVIRPLPIRQQTLAIFQAVWPFGEILPLWQKWQKSLQVFGKFLMVYFLFGKMLSLLLQIYTIIELIFIVANGQILKNNLAFWSHCFQTRRRRRTRRSAQEVRRVVVVVCRCRFFRTKLHQSFTLFRQIWNEKTLVYTKHLSGETLHLRFLAFLRVFARFCCVLTINFNATLNNFIITVRWCGENNTLCVSTSKRQRK